uniref:Otoancorin n=1 Tax=Cacopsylla melanoneura TaxID=428564 RepID=A0A8D9BG55_9HEMI
MFRLLRNLPMFVIIGFSLVALFPNINCAESPTCDDIKKLDSLKTLTKEDIKSLKNVNDLDECIVLLGKDQLSLDIETLLWKIIVEFFGGSENIPDESLRLLGWVISGIPVQDFKNISFNDIDTISAFGTYRNLSQAQLFALKESVQDQWSGKLPEDFTGYDLASLQNILCAFNSTEIALIHADAYKDAASELSTLKGCPNEIYESLALLATDVKGFHDPSTWTNTQVTAVGCVLNGLVNVEQIPPKAMEGLTSDIVFCLNPTVLQRMTTNQIGNFPASAASALSSSQRNVMQYAKIKLINAKLEK